MAAVLGYYLAFRPGFWESAKVIVLWLILFNIAPLFLADDDISYAAHIGGFAAGIVLGVAYDAIARRWTAKA